MFIKVLKNGPTTKLIVKDTVNQKRVIIVKFLSQVLKKFLTDLKQYNLLIKTRVENKRTNLGKIYLENT